MWVDQQSTNFLQSTIPFGVYVVGPFQEQGQAFIPWSLSDAFHHRQGYQVLEEYDRWFHIVYRMANKQTELESAFLRDPGIPSPPYYKAIEKERERMVNTESNDFLWGLIFHYLVHRSGWQPNRPDLRVASSWNQSSWRKKSIREWESPSYWLD